MTSHVEPALRRAAGYVVKELKEGDWAKADDIWSLAFGRGWARDHAHKELSRVFGAFEKDELHAVAGVIDYEITFADKWVPCGGVAAVATAPGQRYQNLITLLLTEAVKEMHGRKVPFTSLYPFSYPFYEKMGWAASHWQYRIESETSWLQRVCKGGNAKRFRMVSQQECDLIVPIYNRVAERRWNLSLKRQARKFKSMIDWPNLLWKLFVHEHGYMLWEMERSKEHLHVAEFVYENEQAFLDGLALLAQMDSQFKKIMWIDVDPEPFLKLGMPYPKPTIYRDPAMMTRVVDVDAFEKLLSRSLGGMRVCDPLGVSAAKDGDIGVGEIVQLVTGFWQSPKPGQPAELHKISGSRPSFCLEKY